jgi:cellulose synthase/poly-beta-1,6-N-acetylglucosamine synthase-like glycosyltransferase
VTHQLLQRVPYNAFSLTEDVEFGIELGLAGYRVHYADEAHADGEMVSTSQSATKQRQRWEDGRFQLIRSRTIPLLSASIRRRSLMCFDLASDLLVLPLSYVALNSIALLILAAVLSWNNSVFLPWLWLALGCALSLALYVLRGWQLSGVGLRGLLDLGYAPVFLCWKIVSVLGRRHSKEWVRTDRERS